MLFRSKTGVDLVMVDVVVRDKSGAIVRGLAPADFEIYEDGKLQTLSSFDFEEVTTAAPKPLDALTTILDEGKVTLTTAAKPARRATTAATARAPRRPSATARSM